MLLQGRVATVCYKPCRSLPAGAAYNAGMKISVRIFLLLGLSVLALAAGAQPAPPPPGYQGPGPGYGQGQRGPMRDLSAEQREDRRREHRQRREVWQQMSPEERHQLRRDIRDAGQELYPRERQRRGD